MTPQAPFLVSSFEVAKTPTHTLGTSAITLVTDAEELAEHLRPGICSKKVILPFCEHFNRYESKTYGFLLRADMRLVTSPLISA
jgi:hypothetical protein